MNHISAILSSKFPGPHRVPVPANAADAVKRYSQGPKILLKPLDDGPEVSFTPCVFRHSLAATNRIIVLAKSDVEDSEMVSIEIYDPRYLKERAAGQPCCKYHPWKLANEQAAAMARTENSHLSNQELKQILHSHKAEELSGEDLATHNILWEEYCYRLVMGSYELDLCAYERMRDSDDQEFASHLIMTGQFLPQEERAIRLPAIVTRCANVRY